MDTLHKTALELIKRGYSVIPIYAESKAPGIKDKEGKEVKRGYLWKEYQTNIISEARLKSFIKDRDGIGIVCGGVSDNLLCFDIDMKHNIYNDLDNFEAEFEEYLSNIGVNRYVKESTQNKGFHYIVKTVEPKQTTKFAKVLNEKSEDLTMLESKGEGGYFVTAPTKGYEILAGSFDDLETISNEQYDLIVKFLRSYDRYNPELPDFAPEPTEPKQDKTFDDDRAGDIFNKEKTLDDFLTYLLDKGFKVESDLSDKIQLTRPGKNHGNSATLWKESKLLYNFSSNTKDLDNDKGYSYFQVRSFYDYGGDFKACAKDIAKELNLSDRKAEPEKTVEELQEYIYIPTWNNRPEQTEPTLLLNDCRIGSKGNLTIFIALPGIGKSAICEAIVSSVLNKDTDCLGFQTNCKTVTYIDTERSKEDHWRSWKRCMRRANIDYPNIPDNAKFMLYRTVPSVAERTKLLNAILEQEKSELLILDNITDFISAANDETESNNFLTKLSALAAKNDISIVGTIHANPGIKSEFKARGHIGSEAMRRAESVFAIQRDQMTGQRTITTNFSNGKVRNANDMIESYFKWNEELMMFTSCENIVKSSSEAKQFEKLSGIAMKAFKEKPSQKYSELVSNICEVTGTGIPNGKTKIKVMNQLGIIIQVDDNYRLNMNDFEEEEAPF